MKVDTLFRKLKITSGRLSPSILVILFVLVAGLLSASPAWEGTAAAGDYGDFPATGLYGASDSFPAETRVKIENLESGKSVVVQIVKRLNTENLLILLSPEAADELEVEPRSAARVRIVEKAPEADDTPLFADDLPFHPDPEINPAAEVGDPNQVVYFDNYAIELKPRSPADSEPEAETVVEKEPETEPEVVPEPASPPEPEAEPEIGTSELAEAQDPAGDTGEEPESEPAAEEESKITKTDILHGEAAPVKEALAAESEVAPESPEAAETEMQEPEVVLESVDEALIREGANGEAGPGADAEPVPPKEIAATPETAPAPRAVLLSSGVGYRRSARKESGPFYMQPPAAPAPESPPMSAERIAAAEELQHPRPEERREEEYLAVRDIPQPPARAEEPEPRGPAPLLANSSGEAPDPLWLAEVEYRDEPQAPVEKKSELELVDAGTSAARPAEASFTAAITGEPAWYAEEADRDGDDGSQEEAARLIAATDFQLPQAEGLSLPVLAEPLPDERAMVVEAPKADTDPAAPAVLEGSYNGYRSGPSRDLSGEGMVLADPVTIGPEKPYAYGMETIPQDWQGRLAAGPVAEPELNPAEAEGAAVVQAASGGYRTPQEEAAAEPLYDVAEAPLRDPAGKEGPAPELSPAQPALTAQVDAGSVEEPVLIEPEEPEGEADYAEPEGEIPDRETTEIVLEPAEARPPEPAESTVVDSGESAVVDSGESTDVDAGETSDVDADETSTEGSGDVPLEPLEQELAEADEPAESPAVEEVESPDVDGADPAAPGVQVTQRLAGDSHYLQLGVYGDRGFALANLEPLKEVYPVTLWEVEEGERKQYKILVGPLNPDESGILLYNFKSSGYPDAFVRRLD